MFHIVGGRLSLNAVHYFILENGQLSDRYRIRTDTGCIVSNWLLFYRGKPDVTCINAGSAAVNRSHYTGRSKDIRAPSPAACARHLIVHDTEGGWRGGRRKETVTFTSLPVTPRRHSTGSWPSATDDAARTPPPAGSANNSQLSITLTFL